MFLINFSHPVTPDQVQAIGADEVRTVKVQLDMNQDLETQIPSIIDSVGFTSEQWQMAPFIIRLPGLADAAAAIVAEIHGRCGHFPTIAQITSNPQGGFAFRKRVNLQTMRNESRTRR